jgi:hypothetical protein
MLSTYAAREVFDARIEESGCFGCGRDGVPIGLIVR